MTPMINIVLVWGSLAAWCGIVGVWLALLAMQRRLLMDGMMLTPIETRHDRPVPRVCVVLPVRNEEARLAACVEQILAQRYPELELVVVDDRSTDETAAIGARLAAEDSRISLIRLTTLPEGWLGKSHALWQGTRGRNADWLLFIDADCSLHPLAVRTVVATAEDRRVDLLTLWPGDAATGFWPRLLVPLCGGVIAMWFGHGSWHRPSGGPAFANGQFVLIQRSGYERIGGHLAVRRAVIEDVVLADRAKQGGLRLWAAGGRDLMRVCMYDGLRETVDGWARIFAGALRSGCRIVLSIAWLIVGSLMPFVAMPLLVLGWITTQHASAGLVAATLACSLHLLAIYAVSYRFWGMGGSDRRLLLIYPLAVVVVLAILARAWWWLVVRRRIPWRGRVYPINRRGEIVS